MAYASLVIVSDVIDRILSRCQEPVPVCDKDQLRSLHGKVIHLQQFLEDISGKPHSSSMIEEVETQIRDTAYVLEDIVEPILLRSLADQADEVEIDAQSISIVPTAASFARCVEEVDRLLEKAVQMKNVLDDKIKSGNIHSYATSSMSTGPPGATKTKVGLDGVLSQILRQVNGGESMVQVIPITGMGGIGKTTLATAVFEDKANCFDIRLWATVSHEYNIQDILKQLVDHEAELTIVSVHKRLIGRRYLVVLDDVWDEKVWDAVRNAFPDDQNGSRVVLTTRLSEVAAYVCSSSSHAHQMQLLNNEQSWDLLRGKVFGAQPCPGEFEDVGRTISRNCKGLPLAVVVTAGLLKSNMTKKDYWEEVAEHTTANSAANYDSLLEILSLSYTNLPPHLKACFLYMGAFREDEEISTNELVVLWTAEGFLKPRESRMMEEVAEGCLNQLAERNLVSVVKKTSLGKIRTSSIHDALRDLSLREASKENFLCHSKERSTDDDNFQKIIDGQRRVSISNSGYKEMLFKHCTAHVRTYRHPSDFYFDADDTIHCKLLRVLGNAGIADESYLRSLFRQLPNLRYLHLELEWTLSRSIDFESISMLPNLEALIVTGGERRHGNTLRYNLILSPEIWEMPRLRHIQLLRRSFLAPPESEENEFRLESLQSLCGVTDLRFTREVIEKIPNVKKLKLVYMFQWNDEFSNQPLISPGEPYQLDNLVHLCQLEVLSIRCEHNDYRFAKVRDLAFPDQLKKLTLRGTEIPWENMSIVGSLPNLEVLKLEWGSDQGDVWEPTEGDFPELKYLKLRNLGLRKWRADETHFPCLEKLYIQSCNLLQEVPASFGDIYTIEKLIVRSTPHSVEKSVRRIQEEQRKKGNTLLQVYIFYSDEKLPE